MVKLVEWLKKSTNTGKISWEINKIMTKWEGNMFWPHNKSLTKLLPKKWKKCNENSKISRGIWLPKFVRMSLSEGRWIFKIDFLYSIRLYQFKTFDDINLTNSSNTNPSRDYPNSSLAITTNSLFAEGLCEDLGWKGCLGKLMMICEVQYSLEGWKPNFRTSQNVDIKSRYGENNSRDKVARVAKYSKSSQLACL